MGQIPHESERDRALTAAYPWGARDMYPYNAWCLTRGDVLRGRKVRSGVKSTLPGAEEQLPLWDAEE